MDLTGHPADVPLEPPATPWGARILLAFVALLFMLVALACNSTGGGGGAATATPAAPPKIASFAPLSGTAGETIVTITGTGFDKFTAVKFGTVPALTAKSTRGTTITVQVPAGASTGAITVVTPLGFHTSTASFTVTPKPAQEPVVNTFDPAAGPVGTPVTLRGIGFAGATEVSFGNTGTTDFTVQDGNTILVNVPAGAETGVLSVTTPVNVATTDASFVVLPTPLMHHLPPDVTAFSPASGAVGTRVELSGERFEGQVKVAFNGVAATRVEREDAQHLAAYVPATATTGRITVSASGGTASSKTDFTVLASPAGSITQFTPDHGAPGDLVTLTGIGFGGATAVTFGSVAAAPMGDVTDTRIVVRVPDGAVTGPLEVLTGDLRITSTGTFTVTNGGTFPTLPVLEGMAPSFGTPGTTITLTGSGLLDAQQVYFNTVATRFRVQDDGTVLAEVPAAATTGIVTVATRAGSAALGTFIVGSPSAPPQITSFSPSQGTPPLQVTILGNALGGATQVTFGGMKADEQYLDSLGNLVATVPPGASTGKIGVVTDAGMTFSNDVFTVVPPAPPLLTGMDTDPVPIGEPLTITGATGLTQVAAVIFTGAGDTHVLVDTFDTVMDTTIVVKVPVEAVDGPVAVLYRGIQLAVPGSLAVLPGKPVIDSYYPTRGIPGTVVTLYGRNLNAATKVAFRGKVLDHSRWDVSANGKRLQVRVPDGLPPSGNGLFAVVTPSGADVTKSGFNVMPSRSGTGQLSLATIPGGMPLLDFPVMRRVLPYVLSLPQAPVFHPRYPVANLLPGPDQTPSRLDQHDPANTISLQLPDVFYPALPADLRFEIERLGFRNNLEILVSSQHNIYNSERNRADYRSERDDYEFKPQYWMWPEASNAGTDADYAEIRAGLFSPVGDTTALDAGLNLNGWGVGLMTHLPTPVALGPFSPDQVSTAAIFPTPDRLVLGGIHFENSYGFWSLTIADKAVATLHLLVRDSDQAILNNAADPGAVVTLNGLFAYLKLRGFTAYPALGSLVRPIVTSWKLEPVVDTGAVPAQDLGIDQLVLSGDMLGTTSGITVTDPDGNVTDVTPDGFTVDSDAQVRVLVPRAKSATLWVQITTAYGVSQPERVDLLNTITR